MVIITGDTHGKMDRIVNLSKQQNLSDEDTIVILGDVGINYRGAIYDEYKKSMLTEQKATIFCIQGNHENRASNIPTYKEKIWHGGKVLYEKEYPNIIFAQDGEIFDLDGFKCIVIGGAYSVDKYYRLYYGYNWFEDEQPSDEIKAYVEKQIAERKIDVVFSHTCPYKYIPTEAFISGIDQNTVDNSTELWLDKIESKIDYTAWHCGHWHIDKRIDKMHFQFESYEVLGG